MPALVGVVTATLHIRQPLVSIEHQPILMNGVLAAVCFSLAAWLFWGLELVVQRVCSRFDERHDRLEAAAEAHASATQGALNRSHRKLARLCKLIEDAERRLAETERRLGHAQQQLATIEQQGVALGAAFIEDGVPQDSWRNN
ncbi:hypothetical protein AB0B28_08340 [Glycomyces sp. NPDC046736]|uniref:hypothetical protein n=1 Tax=Glycomyces sp. NPDC046736 TaxID=3155615 RepID=UPI003410D27F